MKFIYNNLEANNGVDRPVEASGNNPKKPSQTIPTRVERDEAVRDRLRNNITSEVRLKNLAESIKNDSIDSEKLPSREEILQEIKIIPLNEFSSAILSLSKEEQRIIFLGKDGKVDFYDREREIRAIPELIRNLGLEEKTATRDDKNTLTELVKRMPTMNNHEFLKISPKKRLSLITIGNIESSSVASGNTTDITFTFTFTFEGQYNEALWAKTTAGQSLPAEVRTVQSEGSEWTRSGISGEFFNASGQRLLIHEGTKIAVKKLATPDELEIMEKAAKERANKAAPEPKDGESGYDEKMKKFKIAEKASRKGVDPKFALISYEKMLMPGMKKDANLEDLHSQMDDFFTDIDRYKEVFTSLPKLDPNKFKDIKTYNSDGSMTKEFMAYSLGVINKDKRNDIMSAYGFSAADISETEKFVSLPYKPSGYDYGPWRMEELKLEKTDYTQEDLDQIKKVRRFPPGSAITQRLFMNAAKAVNLPAEWGKSEALHWILAKESNGVVGRLNYTFKNIFPGSRLDDPKLMNHVHSTLKSGRRLQNRSSATGLGQLLLSNVKKYYPGGVAGIGDPLAEAAGMLNYISSRYGSPERAKALYGTRHEGY